MPDLPTLGQRIAAIRAQLDRLGDVDALAPDQLGGPLRTLITLTGLVEDATTDCVRRYRTVASWGDIAPMFGVSKQAVNERFTRRIKQLEQAAEPIGAAAAGREAR